MLRKNRRMQEKTLECALRSDFQQIFTEDMAGLHLLALLLTADPGKAEDCFVPGLQEGYCGDSIFNRWARSWSKRVIIKNAINALRPAARRSSRAADVGSCWNGRARITKQSGGNFVAVTRLDAFDRFVLVMTVLEGYSLDDCSALLGCPIQEVTQSKSLALQRLGSEPVGVKKDRNKGSVSWAAFLSPTQPA